MTTTPGPVTVRQMSAEEQERYPLVVDRERIVRLARQYPASSVVILARICRVPPETVSGILAAAGIERAWSNRFDEPLTEETLRADVAAGLTIADMARKYRRKSEDVGTLLELLGMARPAKDGSISRRIIRPSAAKEEKELAVPASVTHPEPAAEMPPESGADHRLDLSQYRKRPERKPRKQITREQVMALLEEGLPGRDAALRLGIGYSTYTGLLKEYGLVGYRRGAPPASASQPESAEAEVSMFTASGLDAWPERDESVVLVVRRGLTGSEARRYVEGAAKHLADEYRYDLQIILREVI